MDVAGRSEVFFSAGHWRTRHTKKMVVIFIFCHCAFTIFYCHNDQKRTGYYGYGISRLPVGNIHKQTLANPGERVGNILINAKTSGGYVHLALLFLEGKKKLEEFDLAVGNYSHGNHSNQPGCVPPIDPAMD